jgi:DNA-binding SARP family transcriptional activator
VAFALWPDASESDARRALTSALFRLRQLAPDRLSWLRTDRGSISFKDVWIDALAFQRLAGSSTRADHRAALELFVGDLLPAVDAEWVDLPRAALRDLAISALASVTIEDESTGNLSTALVGARRWALVDPFDEAAHQAVMRLYARLDRHAAALDHFDALNARLAGELGVQPAAATMALADRIRSELALAGRSTPRGQTNPIVGRDRERRRLLESLDLAAAGSGGIAVILGEAGIGKTRLLQEVDGAADWRGWQTSWGRAEQFTLPAPFAPLSDGDRGPCAGTALESVAGCPRFGRPAAGRIGGPRAGRSRAAGSTAGVARRRAVGGRGRVGAARRSSARARQGARPRRDGRPTR